MQITQAKVLQDNFKAGLQICGEEDGELQWIGTDKDWKMAHEEEIENEVNEMLYEKQGDLEDLARDNFLDK